MKSSLEKRILLFAGAILTLTIALNTAFNIGGFVQSYREGLQLRSQTVAVGLKRSIENVLALGISLAEMDGLNGRCQDIVANDPEVVYCRITNPKSELLYSSNSFLPRENKTEILKVIDPSTTLLYDPLLGKVYDVSVPLIAADGSPAGKIHVGYPLLVLQERSSDAFRRSLGVLVGAFVIVFAVVVFFIKRDLIGPIQRLRQVAREIAAGNFSVSLPSVASVELSELSGSLAEMAQSLRERDERIQQNYVELEETNRQLQESYEFQERISAELGRSREMYRSLLEYASDAIIVSDEEDRVVLLNKAAEEFFGIARNQIEGGNLFYGLQLMQSEDIGAYYDLHQRVIAGNPVESEIRFVRPKDHRRLIGWVNASPVIGRDGKRLVQAIIRDVTREREVKENLEHSARELERLNQMKDSFLGVASHELKTPLTVIIGYAELVLSEYRETLDPAVLSMIEHIASAGDRLSSIVRDMVDVSLLDRRHLSLKRRPVSIGELLAAASREAEPFLSLRHQTISVAADEGLPPVLCDPERVIQALNNLIGNAIKFTPDGGRITLSSRMIRSLRPPLCCARTESLTTQPIDSVPHPYIEIVCADNGIGIHPADQERIFEKFFEVGSIEEHFSAKVAFKGKGVGLGLAIAKGIVDMHGGEIWVESPGHDPDGCPGSSFHILLPLAE